MKLTLKQRAYAYRIFLALAALGIGYGIVSDEKAGLWLGVVTAVLGNGLATANTKPPKTGGEDGVSVATACLVIIAAVLLLSWLGVHGHVG